MSCLVKKVQKAEKLKMKQCRVIRQQALKDHWLLCTLEALSAALVLMLLADGADLSLCAAYHIGRCSDLLRLAKTDRPDKAPCAPANKNQFRPQRQILRDGDTEFGLLVSSTEGGVARGRLRGPLQATLGDPLHPIAAVKRLLVPRRAAGFVTSAVTERDLRVSLTPPAPAPPLHLAHCPCPP